jgi:hypothetical protein
MAAAVTPVRKILDWVVDMGTSRGCGSRSASADLMAFGIPDEGLEVALRLSGWTGTGIDAPGCEL